MSASKPHEIQLRSDALLMRLLEVSPDPICVTELETSRLILMNDEFSRITGYAREDLAGKTIPDMAIWQNDIERGRYIARLVANGTIHDFPATFSTKHGGMVAVLISASVFDQDGVRYILAVIRDITQRERSRLQYQAILSNAMVGIAFTRDKIFQHTNARYDQMFGWPPGALVGRPVSVVWPTLEAHAAVRRDISP